MAIAKVLLVDDDENARFGLGELLESKGFEITTAAGVPEALRLIISETYEFGRFAHWARQQRGEGKPETFTFLGFTHYCATTRKGRARTSVRELHGTRFLQSNLELKVEKSGACIEHEDGKRKHRCQCKTPH
jgi:hypothetical protein